MKKMLLVLAAGALLALPALANAQTTPSADKPADGGAPAKKTHKKKKAAEGDAAKTDKAAEPAKK